MELEHIKREVANSLTHGFGLLLAVFGVPLLLYLAAGHDSPMYLMGAGVYGTSLLMVYASSTLYHSLQGERIKRFFRVLDHISIFFLIAGSYTPFVFIFLNKPVGWTVLTALWCIVIIGSVLKIFYFNRFDKLSTYLYLAMGWGVVLIGNEFMNDIPMSCILWIAAGGLFYTFGIIFYLWHGVRYHHSIWHLFVLAGSGCHYIAVLIGVTKFY